jgi:hypothetical protein
MALTVRGTVLASTAAVALSCPLLLNHIADNRTNDRQKHKAYQDRSEVCL